MIKSIYFPDKTFESREMLFKSLKENEQKIIDLKKASIYKSSEKGQLSTFELLKITEETKGLLSLKDGYIYSVINTTKYMDSHDDVHLDGTFTKSAKEQNGKLFYVSDHSLKISDVIAWPKDVNVMLKKVPWSFVGKDYEGETEALIYEIDKNSIQHEGAKKAIEAKYPVQNSVRMRYENIRMAINSEDKLYEDNKALWDKYYPEIANKERADEVGYFFAVSSAKIMHEGSMVLMGSNDATPIIYTNNEPPKGTPDNEPPKGTQETEEKKPFININLY